MKFPYHEYEVEPTPGLEIGRIFRPVIPIRVIGTIGDARFYALVDTGADQSILPREIGDAIGADLDDERSWQVSGIGGQMITVVAGQVEIEITDRGDTVRWKTMVGFSDLGDPEAAEAVLGHAGCLEFFSATFDGEARQLELNQQPSLPAPANA